MSKGSARGYQNNNHTQQQGEKMKTPTLLDAVRIAKENEKSAMTIYGNAASIRENAVCAPLFTQLSEFERFHYERLTALEKSLVEKGDYINYEGKAFLLPPVLKVEFAEKTDRMSLMEIITEARQFERVSQKAYADLAARLTDPQGHAMFARLAEEEHNHFTILNEAFWSLNQTGTWKGPQRKK
jgi:hypothetical protein